MKERGVHFLLFTLFLCLSASSCFAQSLRDSNSLRVIIIRHGEKPESGFNLSCKGYNRSKELPKVITSLFGVPDYIYVPMIMNGRTANSIRMFQTIIPLAVKYGLLINTKFTETDSVAIAADILLKKGTVLVVWNSKNIASVARNLGITKQELKWNKKDYDSIWIINFERSSDGVLHPIMSTTKENINPSTKCD